MSRFMYIGLDVETTATEIELGAALIQVGVSVYTEENDQIATVVTNVNPLEPVMLWDPESAEIHGIKREDVDTFPSRYDADESIYRWLIEKGADPKARFHNVPVGWNVSGFDMPFIKKYLPNTFSLLSRRTVDLNAVCFALDGKNHMSMEKWKTASKGYALDIDPPTPEYGPHNAGWDATMSLNCFFFLKDAIREITV